MRCQYLVRYFIARVVTREESPGRRQQKDKTDKKKRAFALRVAQADFLSLKSTGLDGVINETHTYLYAIHYREYKCDAINKGDNVRPWEFPLEIPPVPPSCPCSSRAATHRVGGGGGGARGQQACTPFTRSKRFAACRRVFSLLHWFMYAEHVPQHKVLSLCSCSLKQRSIVFRRTSNRH